MGHFCRICGRTRANEKFSGRGHRDHVCKDCQRMPREKRDHIEHVGELWDFLDQGNISAKNIQHLKALAADSDAEVRTLAGLILDIARVHPHKGLRWRNLAMSQKDLFHRFVSALGLEFFAEVLLDYGDTDGPLWDALEGCRIIPQEGSGPSFPPIGCDDDDKQRTN